MILWSRLTGLVLATACLGWAQKPAVAVNQPAGRVELPALRLERPARSAEIDAARIIREASKSFRVIEESFDDQLDEMVQSRNWPPRRLKLMKEQVIADIDATIRQVETALTAHRQSSPDDDAKHLASLRFEREECLKRIDRMAHSAVGRLAYIAGVIH